MFLAPDTPQEISNDPSLSGQVGSILNFTVMFTLAPTAATTASAGGNFVQKAMGDHFLKGWGAPGRL